MAQQSEKTLLLCGAPQSSGSTMVSWCFLQRSDTDGVLDARNDLLPDMPPITAPNGWCKMTVSSFRVLDMVLHFEDAGWDVKPLLVARDFRAVFNSLVTKPYGRNGVTAEEPPLRTRIRRFHQDWKRARRRGWPVIRYESFVEDPEGTLRAVCKQLGLPWDDAMITWPKEREQIAAPGHGSPTFRSSRGGSLKDTLKAELCAPGTSNIPADDLEWLEREFADYNEALGYPAHLDAHACPAGRAIPRYDVTRRARREQKASIRFKNWWRKTVSRVIHGDSKPKGSSHATV